MDEKTIDIDRLRAAEFSMLLEFKRVCGQLRLRYYLVGGTLLGAVRHKGFIPWDDDIDVALPRPDYERFLSEAQARLDGWCFVQDRRTDPDAPFCFAKLRDSRTTFIETSTKLFNINHGIYIDVFPIDYFPDQLLAGKLLWLRLRLQTLRLRNDLTLAEEARHSQKMEAALHLASALTHVIYPTRGKALDARERMLKNQPRSSLAGNACGAWGSKEIVPVEWFGEGRDVVFEGVTFKAPSEWDKYLTHVYGDYMQLPPVDKRVAHHYTEIVNFDIPYTKFKNHFE